MEQPPVDSSVLDASTVDAYGELIFGRRLRVHVLLWVAEHDEVFNQSQAAAGVGYNSSGEVGKELERLVTLDMVRKFGRPSRVGPQNYARIGDHPGWLIAEAARTAMATTGGGALDGGGTHEDAHREAGGLQSAAGPDGDAGEAKDTREVPSIQRHRRRPS